MPSTPTPTNTTGLILAGGGGTRLGHADKGWLDVQGQPQIARVMQRLKPQVSELVVVANRHLAAYQQLGLQVCTDRAPLTGPLTGLISGLSAVTTDWLLWVPVDAPELPADLLERLSATAMQSSAGLALAKDDAGGLVPTCGLLHRDGFAPLEARWQAGERSLQAALLSVVPAPALVAFQSRPAPLSAARWSMNTPTEWLAATTLAQTS